MKKLKIEWKHYDKEGETCTRCNSTGDNIQKSIKAILDDSDFSDTKITFKETKLEANEMSESNSVLIDGQKIEDLLNATASENYCHSCSCLSGTGTNCRTVKYDGNIYEELSTEMIVDAIKKRINR